MLNNFNSTKMRKFPYLQKLKCTAIESVAKLFCLPSHPGFKERVVPTLPPVLLPKMFPDLLVLIQSPLTMQ